MSRLSKISLAPAPWPEEEERVWHYLVKNKLADAREVALNCDVTEATAQHCIDRIGTPREVFEREEAIMKALQDSVDDEGFITYVGDMNDPSPQSSKDKQVGGSHYKDMSIQPWEAMEAWMTEEQFKGFLLGNVIKYVARFQDKGGKLDLQKAKHYLDKLIEIW